MLASLSRLVSGGRAGSGSSQSSRNSASFDDSLITRRVELKTCNQLCSTNHVTHIGRYTPNRNSMMTHLNFLWKKLAVFDCAETSLSAGRSSWTIWLSFALDETSTKPVNVIG
ncbi:hypothetical protein OGATHE_005529 [Ogataea polymorpha]|uniref:Uncharacterized protein n=1 Tax=Ogataea polymorpha TaxID=460523 RepID=A0A9P8NU89_9ASCO|nr:hypothetical protein OGATHE_005529 [Ogataea polymorpha]